VYVFILVSLVRLLSAPRRLLLHSTRHATDVKQIQREVMKGQLNELRKMGEEIERTQWKYS